MDKFDKKTLAEGDGQDGRSTLVAFDGKVYDLSESEKWVKGKHMMRHPAGGDLTTDIKAAPHGAEVFEQFEPVGEFTAEPAADGPNVPWPLSWLYKTFPIIKRHAHPVAVHFPIAFMLGGCLFMLLFLATRHPAFDTTAFHLILLGTVTAPFSIVTGLQSWWLYYGLKISTGILIKLIGAPVMIAIGAATSWMHLDNPQVLMQGGPETIVYIALLIVNVPLAMTIGAIGGKMTFPD